MTNGKIDMLINMHKMDSMQRSIDLAAEEFAREKDKIISKAFKSKFRVSLSEFDTDFAQVIEIDGIKYFYYKGVKFLEMGPDESCYKNDKGWFRIGYRIC